jgi:hypothetical protein
MKRYLFAICITALFACNQNESKEKTENTAMDVSRAFITATLDGNFKAAETLLLKDSQNIQIFDSYKGFYEKLDANKKQGYKNASYVINTFTDVNDSTAIIDYSNSYMNKPMKIKIVRVANTWAVDFKYTSGDTTTTK